MDLTILVIIIQVIFLEGVLSIDNAAVLGTMVVNLPSDQAIPWPAVLRPLARPLNPLLGKQRMAALRVGLLGAYLGRGLMLFLASFIINNPWLKLLGALYLIRLAFENLGMEEETEEETSQRRLDTTRFWVIVLNVELADLIFSLDNVVAVVTLSKMLWVVMIGVALGILMMRFAAGFFSFVIEREPVLKSAAYLLVLNIGIQLILEEFGHLAINDWLRFALSLSIIFLCLLYAHSKLLRRLRPLLIWIAYVFGRLNQGFNWLLTPVIWLFRMVGKGIKAVYDLTQQRVDGKD